ncbi:DUF45 domain-containing protein [Neisseriaceae bacterium TC5R-5]|nr:DUF45 domain-containing protein [Neisseriaceae bacterium TC5R-5]
MITLSYLTGYPQHLLERIHALVAQNQLGTWLEQQYPDAHNVQTDKALYQYVAELKQRYLRNTPVIARVQFDNQQHPMKGTLGTNTFIARVQGSKLKSKNEIRIASLFRDAPEAFLRMIVIHELSHLKEKDHNKAFYQLCCHMEPNYHQLEFGMRVWLSWREYNNKLSSMPK